LGPYFGMALKALFFDFDGLILDTETPEIGVWKEIFAEHGLEYPDEHWISSIGRGADLIEETPIQLLRRMLGRDLEVEAISTERHLRVMAAIEKESVRPGIVRLANEARSFGLRICVVSSSRHSWVDHHLTRLGITSLFETTICRDDVARAKPFPDLYLAACQWAEVQPYESATLEDSPTGLMAANAADVFSVAVPNDSTKHLDLDHARIRWDRLEEKSLSDLTKFFL
jgi:HAD superfamily hydrolase (TIGR01509 family)